MQSHLALMVSPNHEGVARQIRVAPAARRVYLPHIMTQQRALIPASDYETVRAAIAYLSEAGPDELDLPRFARALGKTPRAADRPLPQLVRAESQELRPGGGARSRQGAAARAGERARHHLRGGSEFDLAPARSVRDARGHAARRLPRRRRGHRHGLGRRALALRHGGDHGDALRHFGHRLCRRGNLRRSRLRGSRRALAQRPLHAQRRRDRPLAARIFDPARWDPTRPVRVVLIGTDFEVKVWETLLEIPCGRATTYAEVARKIGRPSAARAVGA
jgi:AraC family transcriptional regulator, regulatory protein of adaptative response / methylated-DNA-[protein]-cysteine methyltransferase